MNMNNLQKTTLVETEVETLSKREQFALAAMQGLASRFVDTDSESDLAEVVVRIADATMAELRKTEVKQDDSDSDDIEFAAGGSKDQEGDDCDCPLCVARRAGKTPEPGDILSFILRKIAEQ